MAVQCYVSRTKVPGWVEGGCCGAAHLTCPQEPKETGVHGRLEHQCIFCDWVEVKYLPDLSKNGWSDRKASILGC